MKQYTAETIKNVGLISHGGAGKTSFAEAMLFDAGMVDRLGRTEDGNTTMDYDPEEIRRKVSISTSIAPAEWNGVKINILDTPGYFDFVGEVKSALRVVDSVLVLVDAVAGVEVGTELVWQYADERHLPRMVVINKMDRENANFDSTLATLKQAFGGKVVPLQMPVGQEASFRGVIDLVDVRAVTYQDGQGQKPQSGDIPADLKGRAGELRDSLIEAAAEGDDEILMKYLDGNELTAEEIRTGLRKGVMVGKIVPVLCASSTKNVGIQPVMDAIVNYLPSPAGAGEVRGLNPRTKEEETRKCAKDAPFSALVFKTMADPYVGKLTVFRVYSGTLKSDTQTYNASKDRTERIGQLFVLKGKQQEAVPEVGTGDIGAVAKLQETTTNDTLADAAKPVVYEPTKFPAPIFSVAVQPKAKGDEEKIGSSLARLTEEDPTLKVERNAQTLQTILSGMGELHLDITTERLKRKFGVDVTLGAPRIPYKETIRGNTKVEGKHKKQTGGRGQYGHVFLELEPLEPGKEFEFVDKIFGGAVPRQYIPAVEKGVREAMVEGVLAGYPVTNLRVTLYDGSYHPVDSSEMAFKIAASMAFKKGCLEARPVMLEPIMNVEVLVPDQFMGDVMGDLNKKRGKILGMEPRGRNQVIKALAPLAEMSRYAIDLRSITQGRGVYSMEFSHYEEIPSNVAEQVIEQAKKEKEAQSK
ncbi:MAG: elongation factor G [Firmicutes bacterium]|nr:elongation factor G [Bacillota bacterium]